MQRDRFVTAATWLDSAAVDLDLAAEIVDRYPSRACFHAQQGAEMALKALLIATADDRPRSRVGDVLVRELQSLGCDVPSDVVNAANGLDLFYMGSRYPDALGGADPSKVLQAADAKLALERARGVFEFAERSMAELADAARAE